MNKKVHLEQVDIERVFEKLQRPSGTLETFSRNGPYHLDVIDYQVDENWYSFTAVGTIEKGVFPNAVKAAHLKELFEEAMLAILRHSEEAKDDQWVPHLRATMTTKEKPPSGEINFSGYIKVEYRENKAPVILYYCEINPHVTYEFEGRIVSDPI